MQPAQAGDSALPAGSFTSTIHRLSPSPSFAILTRAAVSAWYTPKAESATPPRSEESRLGVLVLGICGVGKVNSETNISQEMQT